jgi:hypothetical protein
MTKPKPVRLVRLPGRGRLSELLPEVEPYVQERLIEPILSELALGTPTEPLAIAEAVRSADAGYRQQLEPPALSHYQVERATLLRKIIDALTVNDPGMADEVARTVDALESRFRKGS